jgi:hypothetical protein
MFQELEELQRGGFILILPDSNLFRALEDETNSFKSLWKRNEEFVKELEF